MDPSTVTAVLDAWGYPAFFFLLLLTGIGSPVPDDLLLLTAGYLIFAGVFQWPLALAIGLVGVVTSDLMLYSAGRHLAWRSARGPEQRYLSVDRLQRVTRWFSRCGDVLIFVARLIPGTRAIVFVTAGVHGVRASSFLRHDGLGAALWVPAMLAAGYAAGERLGGIDEALGFLNRSATWLIAAAAILLIIWLRTGREESKL